MGASGERSGRRRGAAIAGALVGVLFWTAGGSAMAFELRSPAFRDGGDIPVDHTCDGADRSPRLNWSAAPEKAKSFALIVDDPDAPAGTWVHWVLYDVAATVKELPEGVPTQERVGGAGTQGANDFRKVGYGGPCPPRGPAHRYVFTLYALDRELGLPPRKTKADVLKAMEGHVLGKAQLTARYARR